MCLDFEGPPFSRDEKVRATDSVQPWNKSTGGDAIDKGDVLTVSDCFQGDQTFPGEWFVRFEEVEGIFPAENFEPMETMEGGSP